MDKYKDIRPYNDDEVRPVLDRLLADDELIGAVGAYKFPKLIKTFPGLMRFALKFVLSQQLKPVSNIRTLQDIIEKYMSYMIKGSTTQFSVSGLENLKPGRAYLFMSNHRDIAMDPALVDYALYHNGHQTVRIAIGDNLLTKPYVTDLMKLNKSFIVKRSVTGPKEVLKAFKLLSGYIYDSITVDNHSIWIAQREGRAKDGIDKTEPAILKMFTVSKSKTEPFADYIKALHIVPVAISYELDPCDASKAKEIYLKSAEGHYEKGAQEDIKSIAAGIAGNKGAVHVAFGKELVEEHACAEDVAAAIDKQVIANYVLHSSSFFAYKRLYGAYPQELCSAAQTPFVIENLKAEEDRFNERVDAVPVEWRETMLKMYANPISSKEQLRAVVTVTVS